MNVIEEYYHILIFLNILYNCVQLGNASIFFLGTSLLFSFSSVMDPG